MLTLSNIELYRGGSALLKDISFSVSAGEMVALVGNSGAGKSTLFRILTAQEAPSGGTLLLDGVKLGRLSAANRQQYRRQVGIVFQDYRLLEGKTVFENVAYALEVSYDTENTERRVQTALHAVGLGDKGDRFPQTLSGGEKQRCALARALVHEPKIVFADEPTGNLDPGNTAGIGEIFTSLNKDYGVTIVFSTHDPALVEQVNPRVLKLEDGLLISDSSKN